LDGIWKSIPLGEEPMKMLSKIRTNIPDEFFTEHLFRSRDISHSSADIFGPREVILSEYLIGN
jgi:hypothetical protein